MDAHQEWWLPPPAKLELPRGGVHVWRASLDLSRRQVDTLLRTLSPDELLRAKRFRFETDCVRFIGARGLLRTILGRYLGSHPRELRFRYGSHGKPALFPVAGETLSFNLSHSGNLALYAMIRDRAIGVDVESMAPEVSWRELAPRVLSARENAALSALPSRRRAETFLSWWTVKEAYLKARGEGLAIDPRVVELLVTADDASRVVAISGEACGNSRWSVQAMRPGAHHVAAVVVEGDDSRLTAWQWAE
jgi:4'-phosphopantetheinyl transferase